MFSRNPVAPSKSDAAVSDACVRSGAFALLLSVLIVLLIPYWLDRPVEIALAQYISDRLNLSIDLEALADDAVWQEYQQLHPDADLTPMAQMTDIHIPFSSDASGKMHLEPSPGRPAGRREPETHPKGAPRPKLSPPAVGTARLNPPSPPTNLVVTPVLGVQVVLQIADVLQSLNDSNVLSLSRRESNYFNYSIVRWVIKRNSLIYHNEIAGVCSPKELNAPNKGKQPADFVPALNREAMMGCLTVRDVRELAEFELPQVFNPPQYGERIGRPIELAPGVLPRDPYLASVIVQVLVFFVMIYFGAYAREGVLSDTFPTQGTLFGAFCKSRWTLLGFLGALWTPFLASLALAIASRKVPLWLCTVAIFGVVLSVHRVLQSRSYFAGLKPPFRLSPASTPL